MGNEVTKGDFGLDSFTFFPTASGDHQEQASKIPDVAFGCGVHNNITDLVGDVHHVHPISGILGLGREHPSSFLLQQSQITLRKYSYCLPLNIGDHSSLSLVMMRNCRQVLLKSKQRQLLDLQMISIS